MDAPMPSTIVLIICRAVLGEPDENSRYTGWRASEFDYTHGVMHCRRQEVSLYDPTVDAGANPQPFTMFQCNRSGVMLGAQFDRTNTDKPWRFWRHACPVPIVDMRTGEIIAWQIPACPHKDGAVICEGDVVI